MHTEVPASMRMSMNEMRFGRKGVAGQQGNIHEHGGLVALSHNFAVARLVSICSYTLQQRAAIHRTIHFQE